MLIVFFSISQTHAQFPLPMNYIDVHLWLLCQYAPCNQLYTCVLLICFMSFVANELWLELEWTAKEESIWLLSLSPEIATFFDECTNIQAHARWHKLQHHNLFRFVSFFIDVIFVEFEQHSSVVSYAPICITSKLPVVCYYIFFFFSAMNRITIELAMDWEL